MSTGSLSNHITNPQEIKFERIGNLSAHWEGGRGDDRGVDSEDGAYENVDGEESPENDEDNVECRTTFITSHCERTVESTTILVQVEGAERLSFAACTRALLQLESVSGLIAVIFICQRV